MMRMMLTTVLVLALAACGSADPDPAGGTRVRPERRRRPYRRRPPLTTAVTAGESLCGVTLADVQALLPNGTRRQ